MTTPEANAIVQKIIEDLTDRRGLRQTWEEMDTVTQREIKRKWGKIIRDEANKLEQGEQG